MFPTFFFDIFSPCRVRVRLRCLVSVFQRSTSDHLLPFLSFPFLFAPRSDLTQMEQQVECLKLEKELTNARRVLGQMRKAGYHAEAD